MDLFLPTLDLLNKDPYPVYRKYRDADPVHQGLPIYPEYPETWYLFRHKDIESTIRDRMFVNDRRSIQSEITHCDVEPARAAFWQEIEMSLLMSDPPLHSDLRSMVSGFFSTKLIRRLIPFVRETAEGLLDRMPFDGEVDLVRDFATPLPVTVIAKIMGLQVDDPMEIRARSGIVANAMAMQVTPEFYERAFSAIRELSDLVAQALKEKTKSLSDDLLSHLAKPANRRGLSDSQLISICCQILVAGQETTVDAIGNSVLALLEHPDQLDLLKASPDQLPNAVEELLRYNSPIQVAMVRFPMKGTEIGGKSINAGACVIGMLGSANRDADYFSNPDTLDITRRFNGRDVVFGQGIHRCLGAHLARTELAIALEALLDRMKAMRLTSHVPTWRDNVVFRGLTTLPVEIRRW